MGDWGFPIWFTISFTNVLLAMIFWKLSDILEAVAR